MKFCKAWAIVARGCLQWSSFGLSDIKEIHLERLFEDRAASTLRKHLRGWRRWMEFCFPLGWSVGAPSLAQVLDFLEALASGACMDCGKGRVSKGMGVLSAMRFVAWKLELKCLRQSLDCSLVRVWSSRDKWQKGHTREAIPLSLKRGVQSVCVCASVLLQACGSSSRACCCRRVSAS